MIRKTLSKEELEEKAREYETVYTKDSSIAEIDGFRNLETEIGITEDQSREKAVINIREELGGSWKQAAHLADSIIDCWRHTGKPENILNYSGFEGEEIQKAIKIVRNTDTYFSRLENHDFPENSGYLLKEDLNKVETDALTEVENVEYFRDSRFEPEEFNIFTSKNQVVTSVVENIKQLNPEETGVIVREDSEYSALLKSLLDSEDIAYHRSQDITDSPHFRNIISLIRTGLTGNRVRLRDLRLLLTGMGVETDLRDSNKFLESLNDDNLEDVKDLINAIQYLSFGEVIDRYEELSGEDLSSIRNTAENIGFLETPVNEIDDLEYLMRQLSLEEETEREGVKIAGPYDSLRMDRENVFILGISSEWNQDIINREWRDVVALEERRQRNFESIIQTGSNQHYMVIDQELNQPVIPCFYLNKLMDKEFTEFTELPHSRYTAKTRKTDSFRKLETNIENEELDKISQTSLNNFAISPRVYYLSKLVSEADEVNRMKGNLFHDFAEFYVNYPGFVDEKGLGIFQEMIVDEMRSLVEDGEIEMIKTETDVGLRSIRKFLDEEGFQRPDQELKENLDQNKRANYFARKFDKGIRSDVAEARFEDKSKGIYGKIDLVLETNHLVDYKSGRKKTKKQLVKSSTVEKVDNVDWPDFQPAMYLSFLRDHVEDHELYFTYYYFLNDIHSQMNGIDSEENKVKLVYYPRRFDEHVKKREVFESLIKDVSKSNDRRKTLEKLGYEGFRNFLERNPIPKTFDYDELEQKGYVNQLVEYGQSEVGDYKYVQKGCKSALRKLVEINQTSFFKEDLDRVEEFVEESIKRINKFKESGFPVEKEDESHLPFNELVIK